MKNPFGHIHIRANAKSSMKTRCGMEMPAHIVHPGFTGACIYLKDHNERFPGHRLNLCTVCIGYALPKYDPFAVVRAVELFHKGLVQGVKLRQFIKMTLGDIDE